MQEAIITLIPKKGNLDKLKHWSSISLLYLDHKILIKFQSNRLKNILPKIISQQQTCSIPTRTIFNNLFLIRDKITLTKEKNTKLSILKLGQEKALDKIDLNFLYKAMNNMGFSNKLIKLIRILYRNNTSFVINNGFLSSPIHLQRGLRQECPLSFPLYVIQEVTTTNIIKNGNIKGI